MDLHLGRIPDAQSFRGELDEVRIYRRALGEAEIQGLVAAGKAVCAAASRKTARTLTLTLGDRQFSGTLQQPAFLAVRLEAGALPLQRRTTPA